MTPTRSPRARRGLLGRVITLAIALGLVAGGGTSAQAVSTPIAPKSPCGHYALVFRDVAPVDDFDLNGDGWHCSGGADNTPVRKPNGATKYFAGGIESGFSAWLSASQRRNQYTATVSAEGESGPFVKTFRYDTNDRFYLNYGDRSAVGGSRLVTLMTFEKALTAAALSPYFHPIRLDVFYSPKTPRSSVFSLYPAPDESPAINDVATLRSGKVTQKGNISVSLNLTCPKADRFTASMTTLTVGSGAPDDIVSTNRGREATGTCTGKRQTITLLLVTQPINGVLYPAPLNCSAEYGVTIDGPTQADNPPRWTIGFDRGGADGGLDGPGPVFCLS